MSVTECVHCHRRVLPAGDGACPSCGKNCNDSIGVDLAMRATRVHRGATMPRLCVACSAEPTTERNFGTADEVVETVKATMFMTVMGMLGARTTAKTPSQPAWRLALPLCSTCHQSGAPKVLYVDDATETVSIVAHERFIDAFTAANEPVQK